MRGSATAVGPQCHQSAPLRSVTPARSERPRSQPLPENPTIAIPTAVGTSVPPSAKENPPILGIPEGTTRPAGSPCETMRTTEPSRLDWGND